MPYKIIQIKDKIVNCYLIKAESGMFMVDCGAVFSRGGVKQALAEAGCKPGDLKLVVLTHGDYDHTGNCVYLREKYEAKIAVHPAENVALEKGDMLATRQSQQGAALRFFMKLGGVIMARKFKPDVLLNDGDDLSSLGLDAKVLHTPGHTQGSISVLTAEGDLFCGDFLNGGKVPGINALVDNMAQMKAGVEKLKGLDIRMIYPGHGRAFTLEELLSRYDGKEE